MRSEWWLTQRDGVWLVEGYKPDNSLWSRAATVYEVELWKMWTHADRELADLRRQLEERTAISGS